VREGFDDETIRMAASIAFYAVFAMAPLLLIAMTVVGLAFDPDTAHAWFVDQLAALAGRDLASTVDHLVTAAAEQRDTGAASGVIGLATLVVGATGVFSELNAALNRVLGVTPRRAAWTRLLRARFAGIGLVLGFGFLAIVSLVVSTALASLGARLGAWAAAWEVVLHGLDLAITLTVLIVVFGVLLRQLPDRAPPRRTVAVGAVTCALLFTGGKFLIASYLGRSGTTSLYGAAGSFVALLLWVYYSSFLMLLGAAFGRSVEEALRGTPLETSNAAPQEVEREGALEAGREVAHERPRSGMRSAIPAPVDPHRAGRA
jgi:membrane protein